MPRPKGSKNKPQNDQADAAQSVTEIVDVSDVSGDEVEKLRAENADLIRRLAEADAARGSEQQSALDMVRAQGLGMDAPTQERPTGRTMPMEKCVGYKRIGWEHGRPIREPIFEVVDEPTYYYKVIMAPCGGIDLKINGNPLMHGAVYELDIDTLRTVKDIVFRTWAHDKAVFGDDKENAYRQKQNPTLSARSYG